MVSEWVWAVNNERGQSITKITDGECGTCKMMRVTVGVVRQ